MSNITNENYSYYIVHLQNRPIRTSTAEKQIICTLAHKQAILQPSFNFLVREAFSCPWLWYNFQTSKSLDANGVKEILFAGGIVGNWLKWHQNEVEQTTTWQANTRTVTPDRRSWLPPFTSPVSESFRCNNRPAIVREANCQGFICFGENGGLLPSTKSLRCCPAPR